MEMYNCKLKIDILEIENRLIFYIFAELLIFKQLHNENETKRQVENATGSS
jgi:hypothetical protein